MNVTQVELAILVVVLIAAVVAIVLTYRGLVLLVVERQKAMDGYVKTVTRDKLTVIREGEKALEEAQRVRDEVRATLERVERHFGDPRLKRMLGD